MDQTRSRIGDAEPVILTLISSLLSEKTRGKRREKREKRRESVALLCKALILLNFSYII